MSSPAVKHAAQRTARYHRADPIPQRTITESMSRLVGNARSRCPDCGSSLTAFDRISHFCNPLAAPTTSTLGEVVYVRSQRVNRL